MKKSVLNVFLTSLLCLLFVIGCSGEKKINTANLKKNDVSSLVNIKTIEVKNKTIEEVLLQVLPVNLGIVPQCFVAKNGKIVYPSQTGKNISKESIELVEKQISFELPANSTLGDLADILSEKLGVKGEFAGNAYLIKLE